MESVESLADPLNPWAQGFPPTAQLAVVAFFAILIGLRLLRVPAVVVAPLGIVYGMALLFQLTFAYESDASTYGVLVRRIAFGVASALLMGAIASRRRAR